MRILVVSDTHRADENYYELLENVDPVDMVIHCGDTEGSELDMEDSCPCTFVAVQGNNDFFSSSPRERVLDMEGHRIFICHGNQYSVSSGMARLIDAAEERNCDVVCFGHTHVPHCKKYNGVLAVNPGSLSYPRQADGMPSFAILDIEENEEATCEMFRM